MSLIRRVLFFFGHNWGAAFILAFAILMIFSAAYLNLGLSSSSNLFATYGLYSLIVGVFLQLTSYIIYGNKQYVEQISTSVPAKRFQFNRKSKILVTMATTAVLLGAAVLVYHPPSVISLGPVTVTQVVTSSTNALTSLQANVFFAKVFPEPGNQTLVSFGIGANGGSPPYTYKVTWSDGFVQANEIGTFSRTFQLGQLIPTSASATVTGTNNQSASIQVEIPISNVSALTTEPQNFHSVTFIETGLLSNFSWSINLNQTIKSSSNNSVVFSGLQNGKYNFDIHYRFNGSLDFAYNYTPPKGSVSVNGSDTHQKEIFVRIPVSQLLVPTALPNISIGNGSTSIVASYRNFLPIPLTATLFANVNDSSGHLVISTASISIDPNSTSSVRIFLVSIPPGKYLVTVYAIYNQLTVSPRSQVTLTIK
ncbi:MAG: hypothetical protein OK457_02320 [Thaumarchaeota archaeon]|nr:hypothetical protein [Nitrososphaerota archaeon]